VTESVRFALISVRTIKPWDAIMPLPTGPEAPERYRFADLTLDVGQRRLWRGREPVPLTRRTFALLQTLVERSPNLVSHATLTDSVWGPNRVVAPENLAQHVMMLRRALGDDAVNPRYIEGLRGEGYRLVPRVQRASTASSAAFESTDQERPYTGLRSRPILITAGSVIFLLGFLLITVYSRQDSAGAGAAKRSAGSAAPVHYLNANDQVRRGDVPYSLPTAIRQLERAVEDDPGFSLAWARLATMHMGMYWLAVDRTDRRREMALSATERAFELEPDLPEAHFAMAAYHYMGSRNYDRALAELEIAEQGMPSDAEIKFLRGDIYRRQGEWESALDLQRRAIAIDPGNVSLIYDHALTYLLLRGYDDAEQYFERVLDIAPEHLSALSDKAAIPLLRDGDIIELKSFAARQGARTREAVRASWLAALYERDYGAALRLLDETEDEVFMDFQSSYTPTASAYGVVYRLLGQAEQARPYFREARAQLEAAMAAGARGFRMQIALAEVMAGLGEHKPALRLAQEVLDAIPPSRDAVDGPHYQIDAVIRVLIPAQANELSIALLDDYLSHDAPWSVEGIMHDPRLDALRDSPRFTALIEKYRRFY
jgi:DNA-binding winged helix-turn-helix (wHTH) protein/Tfp pilus assembly protein PilF